jgi:hypothetical protein
MNILHTGGFIYEEKGAKSKTFEKTHFLKEKTALSGGDLLDCTGYYNLFIYDIVLPEKCYG